MSNRKPQVHATLPEGLLMDIDKLASSLKRSRSEMIELLLRSAVNTRMRQKEVDAKKSRKISDKSADQRKSYTGRSRILPNTEKPTSASGSEAINAFGEI